MKSNRHETGHWSLPPTAPRPGVTFATGLAIKRFVGSSPIASTFRTSRRLGVALIASQIAQFVSRWTQHAHGAFVALAPST